MLHLSSAPLKLLKASESLLKGLLYLHFKLVQWSLYSDTCVECQKYALACSAMNPPRLLKIMLNIKVSLPLWALSLTVTLIHVLPQNVDFCEQEDTFSLENKNCTQNGHHAMYSWVLKSCKKCCRMWFYNVSTKHFK